MANELKPCPFCGGEVSVDMDEGWYWAWQVHCMKCDATFAMPFETKEKAIEAWNRRAEDDQK